VLKRDAYFVEPTIVDISEDAADNSPDNLILLCPNHHTEYDLGFKPRSNVSLEALRAAKSGRYQLISTVVPE
jgi:HNH endonuclease